MRWANRRARTLALIALVGLVVLPLLWLRAWQSAEPDAPANALVPEGLSEVLARDEYEASRSANGLQAPNRAQNLRTYFEPDGIRVHDRTAEGSPELLRLTLRGVGRSGSLAPVEPGEVRVDGPRVEIRRPGLLEWYRNGPDGLEQGFTLESRPAGAESEPVVLSLGVERARARLRDERVILETDHGRQLQYTKLVVRDARAESVPARFAVDAADRIELVVNDAGASYPLVVDPLLSGLIDTMLQSDQSASNFGIPSVTAGDVNGDGYGDVIVGATTYDAGESNEGAAFLFYGSAAGIPNLSATAAVRLESNQANATFGLGTTAGDVNGDGYGDVVVGACGFDAVVPGDNAGAVFVFHGGPAGIVSQSVATANTILLGDQPGAAFCRGRTIGDVNGDGFGDLIVGAMLYDSPEVDEGVAFIYYGSNSGILNGGPTSAVTQIDSDQASAQLGAGGNAGDVNGDGFSDVVIAAPGYSNGESQEGVVFVLHGGAAGLTAAGLLESNQAGAFFGAGGAAPAGDFNGDGYSDVIIGAPSYSNGESLEGAAFLALGSAEGLTGVGTPLEGNQIGGSFGGSVTGAGDVNGDGFADLLIGSPGYDRFADIDAGRVVLLLGSPDATMTPFVGGSGVPAGGWGQAGSRWGTSVGPAGDVNGDGFADAIWSAPFWDAGEADEGAAFISLGSQNLDFSSNPAFRIESNQSGVQLGYSIDGAGDVNADGYDDLIIGAPHFDDGETDGGAAFIFLGSSTGPTEELILPTTGRLMGGQFGAGFGWSVAGAGDVNADGFDDVVVGAPHYDVDAGAAFLFLGSAAGIANATASAFTRLPDPGVPTGNLGWSVDGAGDWNGDGFADVIAGAPGLNSTFIYAGGAAGATSLALQLQLVGVPGGLGTSVSGAGDLNGDGFADVVVGAPSFSDPNHSIAFGSGGAFIAYGFASSSPTTLQLPWPTQTPPITALLWGGPGQYSGLGLDVSGAGDINGDGFSDLAIGGSRNDYVVHGRASAIANGSALSAASSVVLIPETGSYRRFAALGDLDADGFADLALERAFVHGSASGISGGQSIVGAFPGTRIAAAGDLNGDGFPDLALGDPNSSGVSPDPNEGTFAVYYGNANHFGRPVLASQRSSAPPDRRLGAWTRSDQRRLTVSMRGTSPMGRGLVKLQLEICPMQVGWGAEDCVTDTSPSWLDTLASPDGVELRLTSQELAQGALLRWRSRVLRAPMHSLGAIAPVHGPWRRMSGGAFEADVRMPPDTDLDEILDEVDNCPFTPNPGQQDGDSDGDGDVCDNCQLIPNATQLNFDGDSLGDACDLDDDADGIDDSAELLLGTNPLDPDSDDDGLLDGPELAAATNPLDPDSDDDGALDGPDNCRHLANASQANQDADPHGDVCDNCPLTTNADQLDRGGFPGGSDGVGDACQTADVDRDGDVDILDIVLMRRRLVGLEPAIDPSLP